MFTNIKLMSKTGTKDESLKFKLKKKNLIFNFYFINLFNLNFI